MRMPGRRIQLAVLAGAVIGLTMMAVVNLSEACRLKTVVLNDQSLKDWHEQLGLLPDHALLSQPAAKAASKLLSRQEVFKVDIGYAWPDRLEIATNRFTPVVCLLDRSTGRLFGCDKNARIVSLDPTVLDWERPVITGLEAGLLHSFCSDARVGILIDKLKTLRDEKLDLYRLVEEIDLSNKHQVIVSLAGLPYRLKMTADRLLDGIDRSVEFVTSFDADLEKVRLLDVRFDDMIICSEGKR